MTLYKLAFLKFVFERSVLLKTTPPFVDPSAPSIAPVKLQFLNVEFVNETDFDSVS